AIPAGVADVVGEHDSPVAPEMLEDAIEIAKVIPELDDGHEIERPNDLRNHPQALRPPRTLTKLANVPRRNPQIPLARWRHVRSADARAEDLEPAGQRLTQPQSRGRRHVDSPLAVSAHAARA